MDPDSLASGQATMHNGDLAQNRAQSSFYTLRD
jgi:hypothetical protein